MSPDRQRPVGDVLRELRGETFMFTSVGEATLKGRELPMARLLAIAETAEEAEEIARAGARWTVGSYAGRATDDDGNPVDPVERYMNGVVIHGTPDMVVDQLQQLQEEIGLDYLLCSPLSHGTFLLFTEQVLPRIS